jgi:hypothetical protein
MPSSGETSIFRSASPASGIWHPESLTKILWRLSMSETSDLDHFLTTEGLDTKREQEIGQHIGYRYDVNLLPDYSRLTPFLKRYIEMMGWPDLNWLEDVHLGYEEGRPAVFDRNINGWVTVPDGMKLPDNQQDRDMLARELLVRFQMSKRHPLLQLKDAHRKF